jgi:hypothetical protein
LGPNAEVRLLDITPGNLKIKLVSGTAIVEIAMDANGGWFREIAQSRLRYPDVDYPARRVCHQPGRRLPLDIVSAEESKMSVLKGRVVVAGTILSEGRIASVVSGHVSVADREKVEEDAFDTWSRERAAALVRSNKSLKQLEWYKQMQDGKAYLEVADEATSDSGALAPSQRDTDGSPSSKTAGS